MKIAGIELPKWAPYAAAAGILTLILAICTATGGFSSGEDEAAPYRRTPFNEHLTDEMSHFEGMERFDRDMLNFMSYWHLRGAALAVMRHDSLLYVRSYGYADSLALEPMEPRHIMRIASVSKLVTAIGVMKLQEEGRLKLSDKVFNPETGILGKAAYCEKIRDKRYYDITVEYLLRHEGGFTQRLGDPMFTTLQLMKRNGLTEAPDAATLMETQMENRLRYEPGSTKDYSNFGYFVLSLVIEQASGQRYEDYMQEHVLHPAGCWGFRMAENALEDRQMNEVRYYATDKDTLYYEYNGSGRKVERCYSNDVKGLMGAGAWVCSAAELARLVASVDGDPGVPDILSKESVRAMTRSFEKRYSIGWNETDPEIGWVRTGTLSGTNALVKYFPDGECWILLTNTATWKGPGFSRKASAKFSEWRQRWSAKLPRQNLFEIQ